VPDPSMSDPVQVLAASLVTGMIPPVLALQGCSVGSWPA